MCPWDDMIFFVVLALMCFFTIDHLRSISFFCQHAHHDWLTKEYISNWFLVWLAYQVVAMLDRLLVRCFLVPYGLASNNCCRLLDWCYYMVRLVSFGLVSSSRYRLLDRCYHWVPQGLVSSSQNRLNMLRLRAGLSWFLQYLRHCLTIYARLVIRFDEDFVDCSDSFSFSPFQNRNLKSKFYR